MRVLHIGVEKSWRGGENQIRLLAEGLRAQGIETLMAYPKGSPGLERFRENFEVVALNSRSPMDPRSILTLHRFLSANPDVKILDANSPKAHILGIFMKRLHPEVKLVVHRRVDAPISKKFFTRVKYMSPRVDHYVAISNKIRQNLIHYGIAPEKTSLVYSAVDPTVFQSMDREKLRQEWRQKLGLPPDALLVGNASALTMMKGYDTMLEALAKLRDRGVPIHGAIAGNGNDETEIKDLCGRLGLQDKVTFLGFLREVPQFLAALDILCMPSKTEGLGTIILDAILAGCCVVATRVGGIPEIILHEKTGLLADLEDSDELARQMARVIQDPNLRKTLVAQAQEHVRQNFSIESMIEGNLSVYRSLLSAPQRPA